MIDFANQGKTDKKSIFDHICQTGKKAALVNNLEKVKVILVFCVEANLRQMQHFHHGHHCKIVTILILPYLANLSKIAQMWHLR